MSRPTILFVFTAESYHREASPVVADFARRGWSVIVLLGFHSSHTQRVAEACRQQGAIVEMIPADAAYAESGYAFPDVSGNAVVNKSTKKRDWIRNTLIVRALRKVVRSTALGRLLSLPWLVRQCLSRRKVAEELISRHQPVAAILGPYHSSGQIDNAIALALRRRAIPMYCIPNSPYLGALTTRVGRLNHLEQGMASPIITARFDMLNRVLARLFQSWTSVLPNGQRVFYWDPIQMLAATTTGLQMDRTWLKPSLSFSKVFAHSEFSRELMTRDTRDRYPEDRIVVSGPPLLDAVLDHIGDTEHERAMFFHIGLSVRSPFLLFNVEPSAEHLYCDWARHWRNFHETMAATVRCGLPVVLSLHPLCKLETYEFAVKQYGVSISTQFRIHSLYPYCTVSVSFPCSTNLLAPIFKKPLVIYDNFGILGRDEESRVLLMVRGALVAKSGREVTEHVRTFLQDLNTGTTAIAPSDISYRATEIIYKSIAADVGLA